MRIAWDDDEDASESLGIGSISIYERLPPEGANIPKKDPIGFVHFADRAEGMASARGPAKRGKRRTETQ